MEYIWLIVIGAVAGWLAGVFVRGAGFGLVGDIIVGIVGAVFGGWLFRALGIVPADSRWGLFVTAVVGAVVLVAVIRLIKRI